MSADAGIEWPECLSLVVVIKPTSFFGGIFSSANVRILSISGGQLQYSNHPSFANINVNKIAEELVDATTSKEWGLKELGKLDGFLYDPRNPGCTDHAALKGGLLGAKIEEHSDQEITIATDMAETPLRIQFLSKEHCDKFKILVDKNSKCCSLKFNAQLGDAVSKAPK
jgi:hypothetical protein